ncbi:MAG TPA: N-acetylmuramoyl-L-alanine amidase [Acidobacteriota bacterium]|nr:N-acetylmuramoyl-L-alanine amidase [Acidobacteriota bacterium]
MPDNVLVCLDPGHGGLFPGAVGSQFVEKDLTLQLALNLREAVAGDFDIIMTRETDVDLAGYSGALRRDLAERCRVCNEADADLFISLHYNSFHLPTANGFEVLHWHTSSNGKRLAELISERFEPVGREFDVRNRGVKPRKNLYVLRHTHPPAIIVEAGFISNPEEEIAIAGERYRKRLASAILDAIEDFIAPD